MNRLIAYMLYALGKQPTFSTDITGEVTCGYGRLDALGIWEYPLNPRAVTRYKSKR